MTHLLTGSHDGFIRDYDVFAGANGKTVLTAPQRHHAGLADASIKSGVLRSWWENPEGESSLSPVYSMAVQADSLWGLSTTEV
jgi:transcriptional activator SPT8